MQDVHSSYLHLTYQKNQFFFSFLKNNLKLSQNTRIVILYLDNLKKILGVRDILYSRSVSLHICLKSFETRHL